MNITTPNCKAAMESIQCRSRTICRSPGSSSHHAQCSGVPSVSRLSIFDRQYPIGRKKHPVAPIVLQHLPTLDLLPAEPKTHHDCIFCQEAVNQEQKGVRLPCSHTFHKHCITQWLGEHSTPTLCHFTTPRDQWTPQSPDALRPPRIPRSQLPETIEALQRIYQSWVVCTYPYGPPRPMNLPLEIRNDREALIDYLVEHRVICLLEE